MAEDIIPPSSGETPGGAAHPGETPATTPPTGETPGSSTQTPADFQKEIERLSTSLKRANAEAKAEREAAAELKKFKEQIEQADLSEKEKLEKKLAKLQSDHEQATRQLQERTIQSEVRLHGRTAGGNPTHRDKVTRLIDWAALEYDDEGQPTNVKALIDALLEDMPELKTPTAPAPTGGQPPKPPTPALPAMNPGRAAITPPTGSAGPFVRPSLSDAYAQAAQQRRGQ